MITKEQFLKIKKGDIILKEPNRGIAFGRYQYVAIKDCQPSAKVDIAMGSLRDYQEGDCFNTLIFKESNDWHLNPSEDEKKKIRKEILVEITCPHCGGVFRRSETDIEILDELTPEKVGYRLI